MGLITSAILMGILLSLILIGPVFFLLIETSINRGWKHAIVLDLGVILSDVLCILVAYYGSVEIVNYIQGHPSFYVLGGFVICIYGMIMFLSKPNLKMRNLKVVGQNYLKTFFNGFLLNILNIGVVVFWIFIVSTVVIRFPEKNESLLYLVVVILTFFAIDLCKIFLAQTFQEKFTLRRTFYLRKIMGFALVICGIIVILRGFGVFAAIDQQIENGLPL